MTDDDLSRYRVVDTVVADDGVRVDFGIRPAEGACCAALKMPRSEALWVPMLAA